MQRPRWHDVVIVLALVVLAGVGIGAIWGDSIVRMFDSEPARAPAQEPSKGSTDLM